MFEANEKKANVFQVVVTDKEGNNVEAQPSSITILQGAKVEAISFNLGIEVWNAALKELFAPLKGEKGKPRRLPVSPTD